MLETQFPSKLDCRDRIYSHIQSKSTNLIRTWKLKTAPKSSQNVKCHHSNSYTNLCLRQIIGHFHRCLRDLLLNLLPQQQFVYIILLSAKCSIVQQILWQFKTGIDAPSKGVWHSVARFDAGRINGRIATDQLCLLSAQLLQQIVFLQQQFVQFQFALFQRLQFYRRDTFVRNGRQCRSSGMLRWRRR